MPIGAGRLGAKREFETKATSAKKDAKALMQLRSVASIGPIRLGALTNGMFSDAPDSEC